jgi:integrase/recombinase XerD
MPVKLSTTIKKITSLPNATNAALLSEFHLYMKSNGASESHQNNCLKTNMAFAIFLGPSVTFYDIRKRQEITQFLDTKIKSIDIDPDKRWITTWNDYLNDIKCFLRWLFNEKVKKGTERDEDSVSKSDWETPAFLRIKAKKSRRSSPYLETELWTRDELLLVVKYELFKRNKAALTLFWDLDARNHEVTLLKIKHIQLKDRYGEGEIPNEAKTGTGPILLTCSFPYVRDWLNEHPFKNTPEARLICNLHTGGPVGPEAMWTMMKQLRKRIIRLLRNGSIIHEDERRQLEFILKTKKWNPYCIRHSAITSDSDYLPEYALKKKVRWSMNSKQGSRYIKRRMGESLKNQILVHDGIISAESAAAQRKPSVLSCARCSLVNAIDNKFCSKCSYPLTPQAYEEIKEAENSKLQILEEKHRQQMKDLEEKMDQQFKQIMSMVQQNPTLAQLKLEALTKKRIQ